MVDGLNMRKHMNVVKDLRINARTGIVQQKSLMIFNASRLDASRL